MLLHLEPTLLSLTAEVRLRCLTLRIQPVPATLQLSLLSRLASVAPKPSECQPFLKLLRTLNSFCFQCQPALTRRPAHCTRLLHSKPLFLCQSVTLLAQALPRFSQLSSCLSLCHKLTNNWLNNKLLLPLSLPALPRPQAH